MRNNKVMDNIAGLVEQLKIEFPYATEDELIETVRVYLSLKIKGNNEV